MTSSEDHAVSTCNSRLLLLGYVVEFLTLEILQIETLSRVNHKNFVNLLGYCEEVEPFTRMMVFEYAPSGTLFEHLHGN